MKNGVILKAGKDRAIQHRHHWIFSGAIESLPSFQDGDFLPVYSAEGILLGSGYFNQHSSIMGRMITFDATPPLEAIQRSIEQAIQLRKMCFQGQKTNAYRLINGEGDGLPGLIVDLYDQTLVIQIATKGMDRIKPWLVDTFVRMIQPQAIYEKSALSTRREEGLSDHQGLLYGQETEEVKIKENGLSFLVSLKHSQKTGFFLDQRDMRKWVRQWVHGKSVLNAFSYTGGFTVYALDGGAKRVDSVDISDQTLEMARRNVILNGFNQQTDNFICADVFEFLRQTTLPYEFVILDPPAFAKRQKDVLAACRGYKDINRLAMLKMPPHSLLLTSSCSYYVDENLFQKVLFQAASDARRQVRIIGKHRLAVDHPINIYHPESEYLKSFLLFIE